MAITRCGMALAAWGPSRRTATPSAPPEAWLLTRAARSRCQTVAARSRISNRIVGRKECLDLRDSPWGAARWPRLGVLGCCPACHLSRRKPMTTKSMARLAALLAFGAMLALPVGAPAQEIIRIGCPTKTYFPTILATVAKEKGLFEKEGLRPEITIYRGGGET